MTVKVVGTDTATTFNLTVVAAAIDHTLDFFTGDNQMPTRPRIRSSHDTLNNPLNVGMLDRFGNAAAGQPVIFTIQPSGGASATLDRDAEHDGDVGDDGDDHSGSRRHGQGSTHRERHPRHVHRCCVLRRSDAHLHGHEPGPSPSLIPPR